MMSPEEFGETKPTSHAPIIALAAAAVLLLVVGGISYRDFLRSGFEKEAAELRSDLEREFAERERQLLESQGAGPGAPPAAASAAEQPQPGQSPSLAPGALPELDPSLYLSADERRIESGLPRPEDPELDDIRASLERMRQQTQQYEERYRELVGEHDAGGSTEAAGGGLEEREAAVAAAAGGGSEELPDFLRDAATSPPGGDPQVEERLARLREQVVRAPSLGKVISYDRDWGIVTFDAGAGQGVKPGQRFAVRRGGDILGWVRVDQVEDNQSIAVLVTRNRSDDLALKPEAGDDLIDFELF